MPNSCRAVLIVLTSAASVMVILSCDRAGEPQQTDSASLAPAFTPPVSSSQLPIASGWEPSAGPVLLIIGGRPDAAIVVFPDVQGEHAAAELRFDTTALQGATATLINRAGATSTVTLGDRTTPGEEEDCVGWPMRHVASPSGVLSPWTIGLISARLTPIPLDSIGSLPPADSAALVAEIVRLASTVPVREAVAQFRGLPFSVQDVQRFPASPGVDAIVAQVIRRVHQEANPLEERTLLIAERDNTKQRDQHTSYAVVFHERAVGREETLEGSEVLAALTRQDKLRPMLLVARESEGGVRYLLFERAGPRTWRVRWTSALVRC